jgi:hypothetical protein
MKNGDRKQPEAGDLWMATQTTEKYRILSIPIIEGQKFVVFYLADATLSESTIFARGDGISPNFWQVDDGEAHPIAGDAAAIVAQGHWDSQDGHVWIMEVDQFMDFHTGPDGSHIFKFFMIAEAVLEPGDRVSISLPSVQDEIICTVQAVDGDEVLAVFDDGTARFSVGVKRDRVCKLR